MSGVFIGVTVLSCVAVLYFWEYIEPLKNYGYVGAFLFGFLAGSSLPLPLPYLVVTFTLGGVSNAFIVGAASGLGAGIGGTLVYLFGRSSRKLVAGMFSIDPEQKISPRMERLLSLAQNKGGLVVYSMSAMLNPAFGPMAIAMGALKYDLWRFFFWCTLGNITKSLIISYCGYFGLGNLLRWIGVL